VLTSSLLALVVALVPGGVLGFTVPPGRERWMAWAAAPVLTLGLTAVAMAWTQALGLPSGAMAVLVVEVVLAVAIVISSWAAPRALARRRRTHSPKTAPRAPSARGWLLGPRALPGAADLIALAVPAAICVTFAELIIGGFRFPPGWDGMNHAEMTRNILVSGSTAISSVCTTGSFHSAESYGFYPLAADVSWAQISTLGGVHLSSAMSAWAVVVAPFATVLVLYATVRLLGGTPVVAACAGLVPAFIGPLWESMQSGRITEEAGAALAVATGVLAALAMRGKNPVRMGLLAGLATAGLLLTHTYDILFAGTVAVAILFTIPGRIHLPVVLRGLVPTGLATLVAIGPFRTALLGANGERKAAPPIDLHRYGAMFWYWVTDFNRYIMFGYPLPGGGPFQQHVTTVRIALWLTIVCFCASPLCFVFGRLRWGRPWVALWVVWTAIGWWTSTSNSAPALSLSGMWYGVPERVRVMILPLYGLTALAGACGLALAAVTVTRWVFGRPRTVRYASAAAAVGALLLLVPLTALGATGSARGNVRAHLAQFAPHGDSYQRTFQWLADHTSRGSVVAYDRNIDFITWSYADYRVRFLLGIPPVATKSGSRRDWTDRRKAWNWLVDNPGTAPSGCLVNKYAIEYVVVGSPQIPGWKPTYSRTRLATSPNVTLTHQDGALEVYRVTAAGKSC
jgi:uncharacterized protein DUF6541